MGFAKPPPFDSPRLRIRLVRESDLPALLAVNGDADVTRFLPYATWQSMDDAQAWLTRMSGLMNTGTCLQFVIADRQTDVAVGSCLLFRLEEASARAELGYVLGRPHWGGGFMHEALTALIDGAFKVLSLRRLEAEVNPDNMASTRVLDRLGFTREGLARQRWINKGVPTDVASFGLLRHEWPGLEAADDAD